MRQVFLWFLLAVGVAGAADGSDPTITGVLNAASNLAGPIAPGELVVITGLVLGPAQLISAVPGTDSGYSNDLAGTTVHINGTPALLIYAWASQVAAVVPESVAGEAAEVTVTFQGRTSPSFVVPLSPTAPGIFTQDATGQGHAATINRNGMVNLPAHWEGDIMTLFATGIGQATADVTIEGYNLPAIPLSVDKGTVPGVMQINVRIPFGQDCDTRVLLHVGNTMSQSGVTIALDLCI